MPKQFAGISVQGRCFSAATDLRFFKKEAERIALVYGANGSGKSTVSRAFGTLTGSRLPDLTARVLSTDNQPLALPPGCVWVFNEDYVDKNVKIDDDALGSIVLLGEQVELEGKIADTRKELEDATRKYSSTAEQLDLLRNPRYVASPDYQWEHIKSILKAVWAETDSKIKGNKVNSQVTDHVVHEICQMNVTETKEQLRARFEEKQKMSATLAAENPAHVNPIREISVDQQVDVRIITLLGLKIDEPVLTERERLIFRIVQEGNQSTVEESQRHFSSSTEEYCPYCFQQVTDTYRQELLSGIQKVLNKEVDTHISDLQSAELDELQDLYQSYSDLGSELVDSIRKTLAECNEIIKQYNAALRAKRAGVYIPILLSSLGLHDKLNALNSDLRELEKKREELLAATSKRSTLNSELIQLNKQMASISCREAYQTYLRQRHALKQLINRHHEQYGEVQQAQEQLQQLEAQKKNLNLAIDGINESLAYVFLSPDRLSIELRGEHYYLKSRGRDVKPKEVSQGERNIIALCYFFLHIAANRELSRRYDVDQLVVIDDPVSSFDFENKVGIFSLLRREIKAIITGHEESKVVVLTHDLPTMFDLQKLYADVCTTVRPQMDKRKEHYELRNGELTVFGKFRNEYGSLMKSVYEFARGDSSQEMTIGNQMRRLMEAFSTFTYKTGAVEIFSSDRIKADLGAYSDHFENRMFRLVLHGESHFQERIYMAHDSFEFFDFFSVDVKRRTARDILCFLHLINPQHLKSYLPGAEADIQQWLADIDQLLSSQPVNDSTQTTGAQPTGG